MSFQTFEIDAMNQLIELSKEIDERMWDIPQSQHSIANGYCEVCIKVYLEQDHKQKQVTMLFDLYEKKKDRG